MLRFEWNLQKAKANLVKHKVSFEEAGTIFKDAFSITIDDPSHSLSEQRYVTTGFSSRNRLIVAVHTDRGNWIRIISARIATKRERKMYEED